MCVRVCLSVVCVCACVCVCVCVCVPHRQGDVLSQSKRDVARMPALSVGSRHPGSSSFVAAGLALDPVFCVLALPKPNPSSLLVVRQRYWRQPSEAALLARGLLRVKISGSQIVLDRGVPASAASGSGSARAGSVLTKSPGTNGDHTTANGNGLADGDAAGSRTTQTKETTRAGAETATAKETDSATESGSQREQREQRESENEHVRYEKDKNFPIPQYTLSEEVMEASLQRLRTIGYLVLQVRDFRVSGFAFSFLAFSLLLSVSLWRARLFFSQFSAFFVAYHCFLSSTAHHLFFSRGIIKF